MRNQRVLIESAKPTPTMPYSTSPSRPYYRASTMPMGVIDGGGLRGGCWGRWSFLQGHIGAIGGLSVVIENTVNEYFAAD